MNDLYIYDIIGYGDSSAAAVRAAIAQADASQPLDVHVNSEGGLVFDGFAIFNALKAHSAGVNIYVDGLAASAASVIAMAGTKITMGPLSFLMIHEAWSGMMGNKREFQKQAELLGNIDAVSIQQYAARSGNAPEAVQQWLEAETWFNAEQAVEAKMADAIAGAQQAIAFVEIDQKNASGNRWGYKNVPKQLLVDPAIAMQRRGRKQEKQEPPKSPTVDDERRQRLRLAKAG